MNRMLEDLSILPPKRLEKELETLSHEALACDAVTVFDGDPDAGLTVAIHVDSRGRGDILDLARVVEDDPSVQASCGWSLLPPNRQRPKHRPNSFSISVRRFFILATAIHGRARARRSAA